MVTPPNPNHGLPLHDLPVFERPRERLCQFGAEALSASELLALVLGTGLRGESVLVTAQKLLSRFGSLEGVFRASMADLLQVKGLGLAKATQIKACLEIARRIYTGEVIQSEVVMRPSDVYKIVRGRISEEAKEHFLVVSFDVRNRFIGSDVVAVGILNANLIHPRETFESAIRRHAAQVILAHNHPSGDCTPSEEDIQITGRLVDAGRILGIEVIDHLVVSARGYYSFRDHSLI